MIIITKNRLFRDNEKMICPENGNQCGLQCPFLQIDYCPCGYVYLSFKCRKTQLECWWEDYSDSNVNVQCDCCYELKQAVESMIADNHDFGNYDREKKNNVCKEYYPFEIIRSYADFRTWCELVKAYSENKW